MTLPLGTLYRLSIEKLNAVESENNALRARCERLEGALNRYVSKIGNCGEVYDEAKQALEVPK